MTAAYMQILIHAVNGSLFPDADPAAVVWTGPPPEIATIQSLLYASLATSLFAAFLVMHKLYLCRIYGEKVATATECGLEGVHGMMGLEV